MRNNTLNITDALEDLLDKERTAILNGSLENMGRIAVEKEQILDGNDLTAPNQRVLDRLRRKAARNQQLLTAAIRGVRAVSSRLDILRNGPREMNTYNREGQSMTLNSRHQGTLHRRA